MSTDAPDTGSRIREIIDDVRTYLEKRLELFVLTLTERITFMLADAIQRVIGIILLAGGFMFLWFALSFFLSELLGSHSLGFLIGSVPLLIAGFVFVILQPLIITRKIQDGMLRQFLAAFDTARRPEEERNSKRGGSVRAQSKAERTGGEKTPSGTN